MLRRVRQEHGRIPTGPRTRPFDSFDATAAARWAATGSSAGAVVA